MSYTTEAQFETALIAELANKGWRLRGITQPTRCTYDLNSSILPSA